MFGLISQVFSIFKPQAKNKNVELRATLQGQGIQDDLEQSVASCSSSKAKHSFLLPRLYGDSRRLKQILINLIKNAIKFTQSGFIDLKVEYIEEPCRHLDIKVTDTGVGIDPDDIPFLFTRYGKLQRTAKINSEGIGLGLNIVK